MCLQLFWLYQEESPPGIVHFTYLRGRMSQPNYLYYRGYNPFTKYHGHPVCQICYEMFAQMSISLSAKMSSEKHLKKKVSFGIKASLFLWDGWSGPFQGITGEIQLQGVSLWLVNSTKQLASTSWFPQPNPPPHPFRGKNQGTLATPAIPEATCGVKGTGFINYITQKLVSFHKLGPQNQLSKDGWIKLLSFILGHL